MYSVNVLAKHMTAPKIKHWIAAKRIFFYRYIQARGVLEPIPCMDPLSVDHRTMGMDHVNLRRDPSEKLVPLHSIKRTIPHYTNKSIIRLRVC